MLDEDRNGCDDAQIKSAEQRDLVEHLLDKFARRLAGAEARDVAAVLLQVVRHLDRVELDRGVEVSEEDDQSEIDDRIRDGVRLRPAAVAVAGEGSDRSGKRRDRLGKDDRHDAGHVHLHGEVRALSAVHFTADHSLGVLHRNPALGIVHINDKDDDQESSDVHQHSDPPGKIAADDVADRAGDAGREAGDDAGKEDHGDAVSDAVFRDLFAEPHDESGAGGEREDDHDGSPDIGAGDKQTVVLDKHIVGKALKQADADRGITGDGSDLLFAFLALILAHPFKSRDRDAEELDNNGCIDVRLNAQGENRCLRKRAAGHNVQKAKDRVLQGGEVALESCRVHIRNRDRIAYAINQKNDQSEKELFADLFHSPGIL